MLIEGQRRAATAAALAIIFAFACGEEFSSREASGQGGGSSMASSSRATGGPGGGAPMCEGFGDACTNCTAAACPEYACGCWENAACLGIYDCYGQVCPGGIDTPCSKYCFATHGGGISLAVLWGNCASTLCPTECSAMTTTPLTPCQECIYDGCGSAMNECLSSAPCFDYLACATACGDDGPCLQNCANSYPTGIPLADAIQQCALQTCPNCN